MGTINRYFLQHANFLKYKIPVSEIPPPTHRFTIFCYFLELYVKYGKDKPDFNGTHCLTDIMIEDFINAMSVLYNKGHFILGAEMEENFNYALYPDVGTEMGMCKTIKPMVSLNINTIINAMPELSG